MDNKKIIQAGKIVSDVKKYIKPQIKKDMPLIEIAEKIESKIKELGGKPAFPVNLSINEIAAHYTPNHNDETLAHGLLKIDFGAHIDGWTADNAFSIDLENSDENKKLISASRKALEKALEIFEKNIEFKEIGKIIESNISSSGFSPIVNLSGHSMEQWELHSGITVPNIDNRNSKKIEKGLYAIEPFATSGKGKIKEGKPSGIYQLIDEKNPRSSLSREILAFIMEEYQTLPFCSRWIVKEFGTKALFALRELEANKNLHHFPQLIEISGAKVSQSEETIFLDDRKIITTK